MTGRLGFREARPLGPRVTIYDLVQRRYPSHSILGFGDRRDRLLAADGSTGLAQRWVWPRRCFRIARL